MTIAAPVLFLATANDRDDRARYLRNLADETRQVQRALAAAEQRGHCELVLRQNATAGDILDVFQDARYRDRIALFHFGGHADGYRLLLETAEGKPAAADAGGLARLLAQQRGLQLVFLNGCSTEGQVIDLLEAGVQAVIATDQAVEDAAATAFAARFYGGLAGGAAIGTAFEQAKAAMQMQGGAVFRHLGAADEDLAAGRIPWHLHIRPGTETIRDWSLPQAVGDPLFGLPLLSPCDLPDKPYRYLDWYRREDAEVFFGRGREIRTLYDRVMAAGSPSIVLFYGQSGVGKSSLLAAGLLPRLEDSHAVRYARRDQAAGLLGTLAAALGAAPDADLSAAWRAREELTSRPLLIVLDQMEEVFTRPNPQEPDELARLLAGLDSLFADPGRRPQGRLILSFRKEWLAEIDKRLAERKLPRGEVFLERLGREGIAEVVAGPQATPRLRARYRLAVADVLPGLIADDLLADRESPVAPMLAILLADMWEAAKACSYDQPILDADLYHDFRSRGLSLDDFLGRQLQVLHGKQPEVVDSGLALDLLAYHTTPLGTAEQRTLADLEQTYRHRRDVLPNLEQDCRDLFLLVDLSKNQPDHPSTTRLTHDTLAPPVRVRFDESDKPGQRARRILENRAVDWRDGRRGPTLDDPDLALVESGSDGMRSWTQDETRLVQASREENLQRLAEAERIQQALETARQREVEQAQEIARQSAASSRQKTRIIRVLLVILSFVLLAGGLNLYKNLYLNASAWRPMAGKNFPAESVAYAIVYAPVEGTSSRYIYCVATWMVGVGCSQNGSTWNFYQQGFPTGASASASVGGFSGNMRGITALTFDTGNPGVLHAFLTDEHFYRSSNGGQTWISNTNALPVDTEVSTLAAQNELVIAVAHKYKKTLTGREHKNNEQLYISTDEGQNWQLEVGADDTRIGRVYDAGIERGDAGDAVIMAATSNGLWQGHRQDANWTWQPTGLSADARLLAPLPGETQGWVVVTYDPAKHSSTMWLGPAIDLQFVTEWEGEPMRLTVDPRFTDLGEPAMPLAYVLLKNGDIVKISSTGETSRLKGLSSPLYGQPYDLAVVPQPDGKGIWLLLGHRKGLMRYNLEP